MGGAGLIAIKRRIKSVTNTKKITKAMGLVATAKLRKSRKKLAVNENYYNNLESIVDEVISNFEEESIYISGNNCRKKVFVVLTSDTGLCGGFNALVISELLNQIRNQKEESSMIVIGAKGSIYLNRYKIVPIKKWEYIPQDISLKYIEEITDYIINKFENSEIGEVYIVYTKFFSTVNQKVQVEKIIPFQRKKIDKNKIGYFELEGNELIAETARMHINTKLLNSMLNAKSSEETSRMTAMDGATKNADDILEKLNLKYNRIRQSAITQEISEIVGGAEAQK
ncbi:ATP synthase gamma chain [Clostridium acetireducens DSM 10703]|uniref:ATP synthase gamma chain n=1 Tax=Clostridium acetireducens DSM 10703 TaxID=1121290 RepID=A0A1E8EVW7_9CLOT|nr:ATP synthase F1 subunit gamma [Clostridium acetireducens]OFI01402.1 ATP synthase gamma chain [Clostridium acetireducens DSM 10703]